MKKNIVYRTIPGHLLLAVLFFLNFMGGSAVASDNNGLKSINDVVSEDWKKLSGQRIFFGHHSVGNNIFSGINDLQKKHPEISLNIIKSHDAASFSSAAFLHSAVGNNTDPISKIHEFDLFMHNGLGAKADIAFFKFCFVDVVRTTDIQQLFKEYTSVIDKIQKDYPDLTIVHSTVPLQVHKMTWKTYVKNIMKFNSWKYTDNVRRNEFNTMLLAKYGKKGKVFDLALLEATDQDGSIEQFQGPGGKKYLALAPAYSNDGAHLNTIGAKFIAEQLLLFLLNVPISQ